MGKATVAVAVAVSFGFPPVALFALPPVTFPAALRLALVWTDRLTD